MVRIGSLVAAILITAVGGLALVIPAAASDVSRSGRPHVVIAPGGMDIVGRNSLQRSQGTELVVQAPSCARAEFRGTSGAIYVQTTAGTVAWGIYMYDPSANAGPWTVDVFVNQRRVDHKVQNYAPHGSVSPTDAPSGSLFHIVAFHTDLRGTVYQSVPNGCIVHRFASLQRAPT
jgi:hypothetical protein